MVMTLTIINGSDVESVSATKSDVLSMLLQAELRIFICVSAVNVARLAKAASVLGSDVIAPAGLERDFVVSEAGHFPLLVFLTKS